jgi:NADPH:quinone reductase-like Zn-dependent oxidoreductase
MKKLNFDSFGDPREVLQIVESPMPEITDEDVLIKMRFSPINPYELAIVRGENFDLPIPPATGGHEGVGIVVRTGKSVKRFREGQRVIVEPVVLPGTWQQYLKGREDQFFLIPDGVSDESAAVMMNAISTYVVLSEHLKIKPGQWLLCTASTTDIGKILLQYQPIFGFRLINIVRNKIAAEKMRALGAEFIIDASGQDIFSEISNFTNGEGVNGILELVGGKLGTEVAKSLAYRGRLILFSKMSGENLKIDPFLLISKKLSFEGFTAWHWAYNESYDRKQAAFQAVFGFLKEQKLILEPDSIYSFVDFTTAIEHAQRSGKTGKILLSMPE